MILLRYYCSQLRIFRCRMSYWTMIHILKSCKSIYDTLNLGYEKRYHWPEDLSRSRCSTLWARPTHTPAAPESPASMSSGLFGSTTVAIPRMELLQEWERAKCNFSTPRPWYIEVQIPCKHRAQPAGLGHHRSMKLQTCCRFGQNTDVTECIKCKHCEMRINELWYLMRYCAVCKGARAQPVHRIKYFTILCLVTARPCQLQNARVMRR